LPGLGANLVGDSPRETRSLQIQLPDQGFHSVVGLRHGRGIESIGGNDVRAGQQVFTMDACDDLGLRDRQQIIVAAQIAAPVDKTLTSKIRLGQPMPLNHRAHGTVQNDQAPFQQG
jgi:hypothetical protein